MVQVLIRPEKNLELSGFYKSGSAFCTQCEAEGFRRITFYLSVQTSAPLSREPRACVS